MAACPRPCRSCVAFPGLHTGTGIRGENESRIFAHGPRWWLSNASQVIIADCGGFLFGFLPSPPHTKVGHCTYEYEQCYEANGETNRCSSVESSTAASWESIETLWIGGIGRGDRDSLNDAGNGHQRGEGRRGPGRTGSHIGGWFVGGCVGLEMVSVRRCGPHHGESKVRRPVGQEKVIQISWEILPMM